MDEQFPPVLTVSRTPDGVVRHSYRRARVVIYQGEDHFLCLSVKHAAQKLSEILGKHIPATAITNHTRWLQDLLAERRVYLTFPQSARFPFPLPSLLAAST